jgi:hypothetical protein
MIRWSGQIVGRIKGLQPVRNEKRSTLGGVRLGLYRAKWSSGPSGKIQTFRVVTGSFLVCV